MGTDAEGERIKDHMRNITPILLDQTVPPQDKLRIIALYVISKNGITDENLNRLVHHAQISVDDKQTIVNIANLGINVVVDVSRRVFVNYTLYIAEFLTTPCWQFDSMFHMSLSFCIHRATARRCIRYSVRKESRSRPIR